MKSVRPTHQRYLLVTTLVSMSLIILVMIDSYWNIQQDDSYIYYAYAKNLATGDGYVFNVGERINATTSPLYTLLLSLFGLIVQSHWVITLPLAGHLIGGISLFCIGVILMEGFRGEDLSLFPFVLPLVFLANPLLPHAVGMETFLAMALALLSFYAYHKNRFLLASLACSGAIIGRPDMVLAVATLVTYHFITKRCLPTMTMTVIFVIPILMWLVFSVAYFGDPVPSSISAKLGQTKSGWWGTGAVFIKGLFSEYVWRFSEAGKCMWTIGMLAGLGVFMRKMRTGSLFHHPLLPLILLWNLSYLAVYGLILNPPAYPWYYTPLALGMAVIVALSIEWLYCLLYRTLAVRKIILVSAFYLPLTLIALVGPALNYNVPVTSQYETYSMAANWLNANVEDGSSIGAYEIGILRYFYQKGPVLDGLGLVTPGVAEHVSRQDYAWYIKEYWPAYLMVSYPCRCSFERMVREDWFRKKYSLQKVIGTSRRAVSIYKRTDRGTFLDK